MRDLSTNVRPKARPSAAIVALVALSFGLQVAHGATIVVDETTCTLIDAILAANTDSTSGGCPAGSGADTIELTTDVLLTAVHSTETGLPGLESEIVLLGRGHTISRDDAAPVFRLMVIRGSSVVRLEDVTLSNGRTAVTNQIGGGALLVVSGHVTLSGVTVSSNEASRGGGIFNVDFLILENSTISDNSAARNGGGILNAGLIIASHITLSGNSAGEDGGGIYTGIAETRLENSIVANSGSGGNCWAVVDRGNNFSDDGSCGTGFGALTGLDPTLADNGGPTSTHALLPGSNAIDAAGACGFDTDQRGAPRDDSCDSGAFEFQCSIELYLANDETWITFAPETSAFDIVTGHVEDLLVGGDFEDAVCMGSYPSSPAIDLLADPDPGHGRYFLARGLTRCIGAGYGKSSLTPDPRLVLNAGPCP